MLMGDHCHEAGKRKELSCDSRSLKERSELACALLNLSSSQSLPSPRSGSNSWKSILNSGGEPVLHGDEEQPDEPSPMPSHAPRYGINHHHDLISKSRSRSDPNSGGVSFDSDKRPQSFSGLPSDCSTFSLEASSGIQGSRPSSFPSTLMRGSVGDSSRTTFWPYRPFGFNVESGRYVIEPPRQVLVPQTSSPPQQLPQKPAVMRPRYGDLAKLIPGLTDFGGKPGTSSPPRMMPAGEWTRSRDRVGDNGVGIDWGRDSKGGNVSAWNGGRREESVVFFQEVLDSTPTIAAVSWHSGGKDRSLMTLKQREAYDRRQASIARYRRKKHRRKFAQEKRDLSPSRIRPSKASRERPREKGKFIKSRPDFIAITRVKPSTTTAISIDDAYD